MTSLKHVQEALSPVGLTVRRTGFGAEVTVNFRGGSEATAYYTEDLDDALDTGYDMAERMAQVAGEEKAQDRERNLPARWLSTVPA